MATLLRSQVQIREEAPAIRDVTPAPGGVLAIQGITERGPVRTPTLVTSSDDFRSIYGGLITAGDLPLQIDQFFLNGGKQAWVSRVVHYTDITVAATATATRGSVTLNTAATAPGPAVQTGTVVGPWDFRGATAPVTLQVTYGPGVAVAPDRTNTATITATAATRTSLAGPFNMVGVPLTLTLSINGGPTQTITFSASDFVAAGAATAAEVAAAINRQIYDASASVSGATVVLTTDRRGTSPTISAPGGTAAGILGFAAQAGATGNVANLGAVQYTELSTVVAAALTALAPNNGVTLANNAGRFEIRSADAGAAAHVQVTADGAGSSIQAILGLSVVNTLGTSGASVPSLLVEGKYPGSYTSHLTVEVINATDGVADHFDLRVYRDNIRVHWFRNLYMLPSTGPDYAPTYVGVGTVRVGASELIRLTDQTTAGTSLQRRPANTASTTFTIGNDGLTGIADTDYTGNQGAQTGVFAFDTVTGIRTLYAPDRPTVAVVNAQTAYAEVNRGFAAEVIADPPPGLDSTGIVATYAPGTALGLTASEFGALYWPRVTIANPSTAIYGAGATIAIGPGGSIAGRWAFNDERTKKGAFTQGANVDFGVLRGVVGVADTSVLRDDIRDLLYPARVNPINILSGAVFVDGTRTLRGDGNFPSLGERRGVSDIEANLRAAVDIYRHKDVNDTTASELRKTVYLYLLGRARDGCFASTNPNLAFFVDATTDAVTNRRRQLSLRVGLATNVPADWVILIFGQDTRALDAALTR